MVKFDTVFEYTSNLDQILTLKCSAYTFAHFLSLEILEEALKFNVSFKLARLMEKQRTEDKMSKKDFTNVHYGQDLAELGVVHIKYVSFFYFKQKVT